MKGDPLHCFGGEEEANGTFSELKFDMPNPMTAADYKVMSVVTTDECYNTHLQLESYFLRRWYDSQISSDTLMTSSLVSGHK